MQRGSLRVLTWNILRWSRPARLNALGNAIDVVDPDVVLLQEADAHSATALANRLGYAALYVDSGDPATDDSAISHPCILTRLPYRGVLQIQLEGPREGRQPAALAAQLEVAPGRWLEARSVHLSHTHEAGRLGFDRDYLLYDYLGSGWEEPRAESVRRRLAQIPNVFGEPAELGIVGGDINCPPFGPEFREILRLGWADAWSSGPRLGSGTTIVEASPYTSAEAAGYRADGSAWWPGASGPWDYTLDSQFFRGLAPLWAWTIGRGAGQTWPDGKHRATPGEDGWVVEEWPSDHLGIVVDYEFPWELSAS